MHGLLCFSLPLGAIGLRPGVGRERHPERSHVARLRALRGRANLERIAPHHGALDVDDAPRNERGLFIDDLLANVSDDAATLVRLVLRTRKRTGQRPAEVKKHSIRTLLGLGWSGPRIAAAFNEVKEFIR